MNLKTALVASLVVLLAVPFTATADATDDAILDMLRTIEGIPPSVASVSAATASSTPVPIVQTPKTSTAVPKPADMVLAPGHLFSLDGNVPPADPQIEQLRSTLAALTAQYLTVASGLAVQASSSPVASTSASTATPVDQKPAFSRDLSVGSRGEDVRTLQAFLIARGFLFGEVTGYFGILTKTAVITFQTENGLPPVGNVGPRTRALLNSIPLAPGEQTSDLIIGPPARPLIATSTGMSTASSSPETASSTPLFDSFYPPPSVSMSVLPSEADVGGSVAVTWLSQNATSCVASDGWDGPKATLGAARIEPLQFTLNLVLTCTGPGGIASTTALVVVGGEQ